MVSCSIIFQWARQGFGRWIRTTIFLYEKVLHARLYEFSMDNLGKLLASDLRKQFQNPVWLVDFNIMNISINTDNNIFQ
jgi:hypothetical protein